MQAIAEAKVEELSQIKGIGLAKATQIKAVFEIGRRMNNQTPAYKSKELTNPINVYKTVKSKLRDFSKEHFYLITVNTRGWSTSEISVGILNSCIVHPREVFSEAIKANSAAVIFAHNHPSGDTQPSEDDIKLTKRLVEAGKVLGIDVYDHVIICKNGYLSFKEKGLI